MVCEAIRTGAQASHARLPRNNGTNKDDLRHYQISRRQILSGLINRFTVQLQSGCGNSACSTHTCHTFKARYRPHQTRQMTSISARATAVALATSDDPESHLCPFVTALPSVKPPVGTQDRIDSKSIVQQLFNSQPLQSLHEYGTEEPRPNKCDSRACSEETTAMRSGTPLQASRSDTSSSKYLSCEDMITMRNQVGLCEYQDKIKETLHQALSDFVCLSKSFTDDADDVDDASEAKDYVPAIQLDDAFRDWTESEQVLIFDSIWLALEPLFESPWSQPSRSPRRYLSLPLRTKQISAFRVILHAIYALTASVPSVTRQTWAIVWPAVVNGRAYGKQRRWRSDTKESPWLDILDALELEPALRMARRLIRSIAARTCLEETLAASCMSKEKDERLVAAWTVPGESKTRQLITSALINEERRVRKARYGTNLRDEPRHGNALTGTTTLVWLEFLRKCFLKDWDGSFRVNRWAVPGAALEMIESLWHHRDSDALDIPEELFPTPAVFNNIDVERAALDWIDFCHDDPNSRHILSFTFLFSTRVMIMFFRAVNHVLMRRAYGAAGAVSKLRDKTMPWASRKDATYLNQRLKTAQEPYLVLRVKRCAVLSDALDQLWQREQRELQRPLRVRMGVDEGEIGHDLGGVQIEFFKLVCQEILEPGYSLFTVDSDTRLAWFQPASIVPLYKFQLFGILFALAIYNGITLPVSFPMALYRKLCFETCNDSDFQEGWPTMAKAFEDLKTYNGSVEDDLARDYVYSFTANGLLVDADMKTNPWERTKASERPRNRTERSGELKIFGVYPERYHSPAPVQVRNDSEPNISAHEAVTLSAAPQIRADADGLRWPGWTIVAASADESPVPVTNSNRKEFISDYKTWVFDYSIRPQFEAFSNGFYTVMSPEAASILTPQALKLLVEGQNLLDVTLLRHAATYQGYDPTSPVVRWFWETVSEYPQEKQKKLLEFVTASSRVPVNGAENLTFVIEKFVGDKTSLPGSSTCFSTLKLPEYESKEILRQKLDIALEHSLGFGQA